MEKKHYVNIGLLATGAVIGVLITVHFRTPFVFESEFPTAEIEAKTELFKAFSDEQAYLQSKIVSLRQQIEESQTLVAIQSESDNLEYLDILKKDIGLTEITGEGIEIHLDDSPFAIREGAKVTDDNLVQAADLRDLANLLFASGAEAVSINGQRVIATSTISSVGTTILINNSYIAPPFTINAVGDINTLIQRSTDKNTLKSLLERKDDSKVIYDIFPKQRIIIPIYNGDLKVNHLNLVEQ